MVIVFRLLGAGRACFFLTKEGGKPMLSDYEALSLLIKLATFVIYVYINMDNENNQPPNAR